MCCACAATGSPSSEDAGAGKDAGSATTHDGGITAPDGGTSEPDGGTVRTGCGTAPTITGPEYVTITLGGVERQFYLHVMDGYDPETPPPLVVGLHGRDDDGIRMRDHLDLERHAAPGTIFVYPDALRRDWDGLDAIGWQNGPIPSTYGGLEDLVFIDDMLAWLDANHCVDSSLRFATGQSWGGDFSSVLGCYRGDVFRAFVGVAANDPYYLPVGSDAYPCVGEAAAWILHGKADELFPVAVGEAVRDFWMEENGCSHSAPVPFTVAGAASDDACVEYQGCAEQTRQCSDTASTGHQVPFDWYAQETMRFFESFR